MGCPKDREKRQWTHHRGQQLRSLNQSGGGRREKDGLWKIYERVLQNKAK